MFVSFNDTTWWVFDRGTIVVDCVPMRGKGTAEPAAGRGLAGDDAAPVEGEIGSTAAGGEFMGEKIKVGCKERKN